MSRLSLRNVVVGYQSDPVLCGVSFEVPHGALVAVVGPSGCGKTTLLRTIAGLMRARSGEIRLGKRMLTTHGIHLAPEKRQIGWVPQDAGLFPHLTVAENVAFGLGIGRRAVRRAAGEVRVLRLLELVGLSALADRTPAQLSGGQAQRVALARALAAAPELVLLDEPFGALDPLLRGELRSEVRALLAAEGMTGILVTHDQAEALSIADYVAVMNDGMILQFGRPDEVYQRPATPWVAGFVGDHGGSSGPSLQLGFHYSGNFFGGTAGQINYPAPVYYIANFQTNDTVTPASVFFTGPSGSGLSNTESVAKFSNNPGPGAGFASPQKTEVPSGGAWSVNYNGQPVNFTLPNPDSTNRGIIIVPTITVSGDTVTAINWQYKNSAGTTVTPPQSFVANVEFGIDGLVNSQTVRLYDQYNIPFETTAHTLGTPVTWSAVTHLAMTIRDNQNNYFTSHWYATNPPAPTITSLNPTSAPVGNTITITGTNFGCTGCVGGVDAVRFTGPGGSGSSGVSALFTINSSTQITATVPAGVQTGTVWMQALGQTTNSAQTFTAQ